MVSREYTSYQVPENLREDLPYAPPEMVPALVALERTGAALAFGDQPARSYYVAVVLDREEPSADYFLKNVYSRPKDDPLYTRFLQDRIRRYHDRVTAQFRREAAELKDGRYVVSDAVRKRFGSEAAEVE